MDTIVDQANISMTLRSKAEAQLRAGTSPKAGHSPMGADALRLLHQLASNPARADDALKLLHELQVHQVELDLQHEETAANEQALLEDLGFYHALYDCTPLPLCVLDLDGTIMQSNSAAAERFGVPREGLEGQHINAFMPPQSRSRVADLLQQVALSGITDTVVTDLIDEAQRMHLQVSTVQGHKCLLLAFRDTPD